jgi:hypothetical protein
MGSSEADSNGTGRGARTEGEEGEEEQEKRAERLRRISGRDPNRRRSTAPTSAATDEAEIDTGCEEESQRRRRRRRRRRNGISCRVDDGRRRLVEASKWAGLVGAIWVQAFAGNAYTFAHFSDFLKHRLHYNQLQLNNLGVAKDFGENVGLLAGLLCNTLHPSLLLSIGALNGFVGFGLLWLVASHTIDKLPYWLVSTPITYFRCIYPVCGHV